MPTIINADTASGGAIITGDNSGQLQLQSGGVTALTATGANVTVAGTFTATGGVIFTNLTPSTGSVSAPAYAFSGDTNTGMWSPGADTIAFSTNGVEVARLTSAGFLEGVFSDDVVALGNSGTATSIDLRQGTVFTATLTGNCTFTLTNPNANTNRGTSFTLILTNDGTGGRTVAWAGGTFRFPGGASSLGRTTTANAVDIWVFFTPNNGTTWYGSIPMKNLSA